MTCVEVTPPVSKKNEQKTSKKRKFVEGDEDEESEKKLTGKEVNNTLVHMKCDIFITCLFQYMLLNIIVCGQLFWWVT